MLLILSMTVIFLVSAVQPPTQQEYILSEFGFSTATIATHPWSIITSLFLHANLVHLLSNMLVFLFFGLSIERELGAKKFLLIFFLAGIAGNVTSAFFYPAATISIGASAAIFGLVGVGMLVKPADVSFYPYIVPVPLALLGIMYIVFNFYGFLTDTTSGISYIAHFGGLAIGLIAGFHERGIKKGLQIIFLSVVALLAIVIIGLLILKFLF